ncbi:arrestin homolog [Hyalella azteca]|uniref:Arrestin homolog n=1 Tax=Hyalella azteca TaxID=294128 RepID=A0A8B7N289_HYAAZ|nr:arrestin homolog [Hyalella azteca]XP_018007941.1 arrestin homolog [Hyalella azteca]XP_018007942.1 arrestin homolog [Hyalella azteca]XP_047739658.1 arrestin homolog [Hyalella azteca]
MVVQFKVFKKASPNGKLTLYMGRRDFVDHVTSVDPVDGVLVVDTDYLQGRRVFGQLVCSFRYGREDDEVMGLSFQKDLFLASEQIYPPKELEATRLQERLVKKLGANAYPFTFKMPPNAPPSVTIQPGPDDEGKPCGVEYYIKIFVGDSEEDRTHKRSTIVLNIRRIQFAPTKTGRQPCTIVRKDFMLSPGELELEVNLDKQLYYHNEKITVYIIIRNHSNKTVKKVKTSVQQSTDICLFSGGQFQCTVASVETQEGCPVNPGSSLQKELQLLPSLDMNKDRRGVALDGHLKTENTNLASTTLLANPEDRDMFGMIISYSVKVKLYLGAMGGEVTAELPFVLMHPKPDLRRMMRADSQAQVEAFRSDSFGASLDIDAQDG